MEWMPSNMAPWQSQQYSVLHTRTILPLSLSLCLSLSTLSINCGCSGDPNATVNTDNDKPSARNHKQQMWNKMEKTGSVRMFVPLRNGCFLALLINFWRTGHSSFSFFFFSFFLLSLLDRAWRNVHDPVNRGPFFRKTSHQLDKRSAGVDSFHDHRQSSCFLSALTDLTPRCTLNAPACSTLCLFNADCVCVCNAQRWVLPQKLDVVWRLWRSSVFCPSPRGGRGGCLFVCVFCLSRCLNINTEHFSGRNEAPLRIHTSVHFHTAS